MTLLFSEVKYHGVGQGLFISGEITSNERSFKWVYDCGSSSKSGKLILERKIKNLFRQRNEPIVIDMLVISHFDKDHINGCELLLKKFKVNKVILPYIPLWKRILLGLEQKVGITGKYIDFY
ncbi:MBL fold metallo-hydrolase, partial [Klebsiella pneumoniae]|uniref:MBL fold metallo-hydrolase n=3 Tax=Enterobacterales TaxID=91347 RepID=UPI00351010D4